jgi:hypothetical protein
MLFFEIPSEDSCFYFGLKGSLALVVLEIALAFVFQGFGNALLTMTGYGFLIMFGGMISVGINYILSSIFCGNNAWRVVQLALFWIGVGLRVTPHITSLFETHTTKDAKKELQNAT